MPSERIQRQIDRLLDEAETAFARQDWPALQSRARQALALDADNADAQAFLAASLQMLGETTSEAAGSRSASGGAVGEGTPGARGMPGPRASSPSPADAPSPPTQSSVPGPQSFANGRYVVRKFLGEGGKKQVYLAHDTLLDRDVAFALIKTEGLDAIGRDRIKREAQAMGRLGTHPHIVSVFDLGEELAASILRQAQDEREQRATSSGQPFIVTELMGGGDVEGLIEQAPEHRPPLEQTLRIGIEVCRGLDFAHAHGIVHRDLKPGNVWLTASDQPSAISGQRGGGVPLSLAGEGQGASKRGHFPPSVVPRAAWTGEGEPRTPVRARALSEPSVAKLGDFGLAVALDRSRLTQAGMMVGTVSYMPPEQAMGGEVTPRSDLYSLGAMLYEMVTGRPPFVGDESVAIIGQHLHTPPVAPSWHNPTCPRPLEALILRLLAKDPAQRPASAADVQAALEAIDLSGRPPSSESPLEGEPLDSLAGGVFVGRQRELGELKAALEEALSGHGRLVALVGEPGIGKTRTAQELATYAVLRQCQVLWGRCYEGSGAPPYWPWVQFVRAYVRERPAERLRSEMGAGAADIAEVVSEVGERLAGLATPPPLEPEQARFRLFDSITTFLRAASQSQPLVLVLEDLHWADRPSLLLLEFLAHQLSGGRLLVLMTYRDVEVSRQHPLTLTLGELSRERLFQRVVLRGLGHEDVARYIELTTGVTPPAGLAEAVYAQTEGNPLFVTEVVRLLVQEGMLAGSASLPLPAGPALSIRGEGEPRAPAGARAAPAVPVRQSWALRIPDGVREVIGRRLNRLSERCNQMLTLAAVLGRQFSLDQLAVLSTDISREHLVEVIEEALAARLVEELPQAIGQYQFTHALILETLVAELSLTRRVQVHAQIAEALEGLYGAQAGQHAAELAHHYGQAASLLGPAKPVQYSLLAGERALAAYAYEEALAHFQRGLEAKAEGPDDRETAGLLWGLGRSQAALLGLRTAVGTMRRAFDLYLDSQDNAGAVAVAQFPWLAVPSLLAGVADLIEKALPLVPEDSLDAARMLISYATALYMTRGDYGAAQQAFTRAEQLARKHGDRSLEVRVLVAATGVDMYHARFAQGAERGERAMELAQREGDLVAMAAASVFGGGCLANAGELERGERCARAGIDAAERLRDRTYRARVYFLVGWVLWLRGDFRAARELCQLGLSLAPEEARLLSTVAVVEAEAGNLDAASVCVERLLGAWTEARAADLGMGLNGAQAGMRLALITRDADRANGVAQTAEKVLSAPDAPEYYRQVARWVLGVFAVLRGDAAGAAEHYLPLRASARGTNLAFIQVDRVLGLLARTMGDAEAAAAHFEDALAFCRRGGYRLDLGWTCFDYAELLLGESTGSGQQATEVTGSVGARFIAPADEARATVLLDEGLQIAQELGMRPLVERILGHRQILRA